MSRKNLFQSGDVRKITKDVAIRYKPYFQIKAVYFTDDCKYAFVNKMRYEMDAPTVTRGDNLLVAADCLRKIYSPKMKAEIGPEAAVLTYGGKTVTVQLASLEADADGVSFPLEAAAEIIDGRFYLDAESIMEKGFGKAVRWQRSYLAAGDFLGIGDTQADLFENKQVGNDMLIQLNKGTGVLRRAYYYEEGDLLMPYLLYVPFRYDPATPNKLTVVLHGAGAGVGESRDLNWRPTVLETEAEKRNMMLLFPEGYAMGFYGGGNTTLDPSKCSAEEQPYLALCQHEPLHALKQVMNRYNVDEKNVFLTGNSMGGGGTLWLGLHYPERFAALAPCGAFTVEDLSAFDLSPIVGKPVMMVVGSENIGFDNVPNQAAYLTSQKVPTQWRGVPGGVHVSAWTYAFDQVLDFFLEHSK